MLELVICDDEKIFRDDLQKIACTELDLCGIEYHLLEFSCGVDLLNALSPNLKYVIFLDIEMDKMDGMTAAGKIRDKNIDAVIIFVTSYPDYVFKGYEVRALNYLLKPYVKEKIVSVLHLALKDAEISEEQYFLLEQRSGTVRIPLKEILYFYSDKRTLCAVTEDHNYPFYGKLNDISDTLPDYFLRIHNRYLINLSHLYAIEENKACVGAYKLPVSRSCKQELSVAFARYLLK